MKKLISLFILLAFVTFSGIACNTNKPGEEAKDAKDRVQKKVDHEHDNQKEADPGE
jgi:peptidoglycan hydrolase CwlO-like protein